MSAHRRRVRSIVLRVAVFLLLGAVVNVAVGVWGFARFGYGDGYVVGSRTFGTEEDAPALWSKHLRDGWPPRPVLQEWGNKTLCEENVWRALGSHGGFAVGQVQCGVPCRALSFAWWEGPLLIGDNGFAFAGYSVPADVVWPGFAINTVFYAAILWLLFAASGRVRRWRRIRRGLCVRCAYPVGTSDVCTECGASIRPSGAAECSHG